MSTTLCEDCFPEWGSREVITSSIINRCASCGNSYGHPWKTPIRCHTFRNDPRKPVAALLREKDTKQ